MHWLVGHASTRGISHIKSGAPCQDNGSAWLSPDGRILVGAVADGGGSLDRSDIGSAIAASHFVAATAARLMECDLQDISESYFDELWRAVVQDIRATLSLEAKLTFGAALRDYGATLIGFAAFNDCVAAIQIGDGFIVVGSDTDEARSSFNLIFPARPSEHVGEVVWLTSSLWDEDFRCSLIRGKFNLVSASTDGLEGVAISRREQEPFSGFFTPLAQRVFASDSSAKLEELARSIITMKSLDSKTDDDKTLLLARLVP